MNNPGSFLDNVAAHVLAVHGENLHDLTIILPNNRAKLFLSKHLSARITKTTWLPEMVSSKEFMEQTSGLRIVDDVFLMTHLYSAWKKHFPDKQTFNRFLHQGSTILRDFTEIDQELADTEELFPALSDIRTMEAWSPHQEELPEMRERYLQFCGKLPEIYRDFTQAIRNAGIAHAGFAERCAVEKVSEKPPPEEKRFLIAGFNALTRAESLLFRQLADACQTSFYWDYDHYYVDNERHEAGFFARQNLKSHQSQTVSSVSQLFRDTSKSVEIYRCTTPIEQAAVAKQILTELGEAGMTERTALVLADESLLMPVLQHLPDDLEHVNVTMGYPLKLSPFHSLFDSLIRLYFNHTIMNAGRQKTGFYYKDVVRLLMNDALVRYGTKDEINRREEFLQTIHEQSLIHVPPTALNGMLFAEAENEIPDFVGTAESVADQIHVIIHTLDRRLQLDKKRSNNLSREFLLHHNEVLDQVKVLQKQLSESLDMQAFYKVWKQYVNTSKVQFTGEPLLGLQVMGLLETRNLDFDNVILLSTNEGTLPSSRAYETMLPNDLKRNFKLPVHHEREAVFSHHFYRLLQRARKVHLLYYTQSQGIGNAEPSRFIAQLKQELPESSVDHTITEKVVEIPIREVVHQEVSIPKTPLVIDLLQDRLRKGLSPTALTTYLACPLDFYYKYIVGIREQETMVDRVEADILGLVLHDCLEKLYRPFVGKRLTKEIIGEIEKKSTDALEDSFSAHIQLQYLFEGKNLLTYHIAKQYLKTFFLDEVKRVEQFEVELIGLEESVQSSFSLNLNGTETEVVFKGFIDRMERVNQVLHIVDYKTGKVEQRELQIKNIDEMISSQNSMALQLLIYAWIVRAKMGIATDITASVYALRFAGKGFLPIQIEKETNLSTAFFEILKEQLSEVVAEMIRPAAEFRHEVDAKYCNYC